MRVFVGQERTAGNSRTPVGKVIGTHTILARLMVLQALSAHNVAYGKEEIIVIIMMRVEKLLRLDHKVLVILQFLRSDFEGGGLVGEDIEVPRIIRPRRKV